MGIIFACLSALFFGLYYGARKFSTLAPLPFTTLIGASFFVFATLIYGGRELTGNGEDITDPRLAVAVLTGLFWTAAMVMLMKSIDLIGVTRANQWKNLQGPIGIGLSLLILRESATVSAGPAVLAGLCIFGSAWLFNVRKATDKATDRLPTETPTSMVKLQLTTKLQISFLLKKLPIVHLLTKSLAINLLVLCLQTKLLTGHPSKADESFLTEKATYW